MVRASAQAPKHSFKPLAKVETAGGLMRPLAPDDRAEDQDSLSPFGKLPPAADLVPEKYSIYAMRIGSTERNQEELLRTLWGILQTFVELGFSVEANSHLLLPLGQSSADGPLPSSQPCQKE